MSTSIAIEKKERKRASEQSELSSQLDWSPERELTVAVQSSLTLCASSQSKDILEPSTLFSHSLWAETSRRKASSSPNPRTSAILSTSLAAIFDQEDTI